MALRPTSHRVESMPNLIGLPGQAVSKVQQYLERGSAELHYVRKIFESGAFRIEPPLNYAAMAADIYKWGEFGMLPSLNARRHPDKPACMDEEGEFTYRELDEAAHAVANGLLERGVKGGDGVAILARNTRWFLIAYFGAARVGARIILLNSEFSGPQIKEVTSLPAPMFHALGFLHGTIAMFLGSTLVLRRKFKPPLVLEDIEKHKVTAMVVVPVMLSRILGALEKMDKKPDLSSLKIVFVSGSALGADLAERALKDLGPVIYNMYGSTEIAFATIAGPKDLEFNSSTVGPVVKGVKVKIFDDNGNEKPQGEVGRIFVGNAFPFEGYTGGGKKQIINGMLSSGDVGYFDEHGLLYISGRDDEMIVSGGENVFPAEVEDLITGHPDVVVATAIGVEDKGWGHRLRAFVVKKDDAD